MRPTWRPDLLRRGARPVPNGGIKSSGTMADQELRVGREQYRQWQVERDKLVEMIQEAEANLPASSGDAGPCGNQWSSSLSATYRRVEQLERLMAEHADWRPSV